MILVRGPLVVRNPVRRRVTLLLLLLFLFLRSLNVTIRRVPRVLPHNLRKNGLLLCLAILEVHQRRLGPVLDVEHFPLRQPIPIPVLNQPNGPQTASHRPILPRLRRRALLHLLLTRFHLLHGCLVTNITCRSTC